MPTLQIPVSPADHMQGDPTAPVILVEYGDYECPHCRRAYPIVKRVQKHFGHRLAFVFRNFPLKEMHPNAEPAAETAEFAATRDRFWEMHDQIYDNQPVLDVSLLFDLARSLELPEMSLRMALQNHEFAPRIRADFLGGVRSGVNGTPTFFINGQRHDGSWDYDDLLAVIEARLEQEKETA
jgi:protein-disulfide isomerase